MKVILLAIFIVSCASTTNATSIELSTWWYPSDWTTTAYTTTDSTTTELTTTDLPPTETTTTESTTTESTTTESTTTESTTTESTTTESTTTESTTTESTTTESTTTESTTTESTTTASTTTESTTTESTTTESTTTKSTTTESTTTESTTTGSTTTESTTTESATTKSTTTETTTQSALPTYPLDDYCPNEEIKTCGYKYGVPAAKRQFPYVAFLKSRNAYKVQYCSGSLIHPQWVLTSAYCTLPDSKVEVILGALVPFDEEDPDRVVVHSEVVYIHPGYLPLYKNPKNDVALIKLSKPVTSDAIIPIGLKRDAGPISKDNITYAGWGAVGYETMTFPKNIWIYKGPCECKSEDDIKEYKDAAGDSEFFCCSSTENFCFIHNGGGLLVDGVLVAVMSMRCFSHCRDGNGIFTNVYNHLQWIGNILNAGCIPDYKVYGACSDIPGFVSGVYLIQPNNDVDPFEVFCEHRVDGEKWTVIQQRFNKSVDFYRNYANYTMGFGSISGNHWLGLEKIHQLTKNGDHELLVELQAHNLTKGYAQYSTFKVDSAGTGFKLTISGYSGNAGDSMTYNKENLWTTNGMKFTTFDKDQDEWADGSCAHYYQGAWWYNWGSISLLNSPYLDTPVETRQAMHWKHDFNRRALKTARMLIRKK